MMVSTISLSTALFIFLVIISVSVVTLCQTCTGDEIIIVLSSQNICDGGNFTIQCQGQTDEIEIYRDTEVLFNGTTLAPVLQPRDVSVIRFTQGINCTSVLVSFKTATKADMGNYTCQKNTTTSSVKRLAVESQVYQHDCQINAATGPVVEKGESISCSSVSGQPSWVTIDPAASLVSTGNVSVTSLAFLSVNTTMVTTLECKVVSFSSSCPSALTSCFDRIVVVPNPVDSYLSLTPPVETINPGGSATYSCTTTLNGARLAITPTISTELISHTVLRFSDTNIQIAFSNITTNFTEPIVQCMLQYSDRLVTSAFASVVVLEVKEVTTTTLPATTSHVSTLAITNRTDMPLSITLTPMVNEIRTEYLSTTGSPTETTTMVNIRSYQIIDTRFLIIGLVIGLLIFIAIIVLCALMFRHHARRKGNWTISSASSRRRGQAEVASSGIEGRLEWETDINHLVLYETTAIDAEASHDNRYPPREDMEDSQVSRSNGYSKPINEAPPVLRFDAVIENHGAHEVEESSSPGLRKKGHCVNRGFSSGYETVIIHRGDVPDVPTNLLPDLITQQSVPNGTIICEQSDVAEQMHNEVENEIDIASLNVIDATKLDASEADKDWDSGLSVGHDSILSEIDDEAINIISV